LANATRQLQAAGVEHTGKTIGGAPGTVLTELAKSGEYDLIVMGSHGHSEISGLFLGSVTHKVLNTIYCPVMVVP
jgi:nucleotide-binding universal stress UspA family protein